jgi:hypothetical protein
MTDSRPNPREGAARDASKPPPAPLHSRIFDNDQGKFFVVASEPYWNARAAMKGRGNHSGWLAR